VGDCRLLHAAPRSEKAIPVRLSCVAPSVPSPIKSLPVLLAQNQRAAAARPTTAASDASIVAALMSSPSVPPAARASVGSALYYSAAVGIPTTEVKGRSSLKPAVRAAGWPGTPPNSTADGPRVAVYRGWPLSGQMWGLAGHCRSPLLDVQQLARTGPKAGWRRATGSGLKRSNSGLLSPDGHPAQNQVSSRKCWFESDRGHHPASHLCASQNLHPEHWMGG
jgi:hypothetical protein